MNAEMAKWFNEEVTVTDRVSFSMRTRVKQARKNYWGVFDTPREPSGREKMWYPLTQWMTDMFIRNSDVDTKDIEFKSKRSGSFGNAQIAKQVVRHFLYKLGFGAILNDFIRRLVTDGTAVNKTIPAATGSDIIDSKNVDLLNFVIDPTAENIQKAPSVIELVEMDIDEYMSHTQWKGKEKLLALIPDNPKFVPKVRVKVRWGKMQENLLDDGDKNSKEWVESLLITSELKGETNGGYSTISETVTTATGSDNAQVVNQLVKSPFDRRPYEEGWFIKVQGRWHGLGVPEIVFDNQQLGNENWNIRFNNARILKNGLFKARIGSGITQQALSSVTDGGVLQVKRMDDLEQMNIQDFRASSYEDEDRINQASQRALGASPQAGGEPLPASTPATIGVLNQQNAATSFETVIENINDAVERIMQYHWLPIIFDSIDSNEIYRISGDKSEIEFLTDKYAERQADKAIIKSIIGGGAVPTPEAQEMLKGAIKQQFNKFGKDRFIKNIREEVLSEDYDIQVVVGNEKFNKAEVIGQLRQLLVELSQIPGTNLKVDELAKEIMDFMGVGGERFFEEREPNQEQQPASITRRAQEQPVDRTVAQQTERQPGGLVSR